MELQPIAQQDLASSAARLNRLLKHMSARTPLPTQSRNAKVGGPGRDEVPGRVAVHFVDVAQESQETGAEEQAYPVSDITARRKGLRILTPKFPGIPETYTAWRDSLLDYAEFHAFAGCCRGIEGKCEAS